MPTATGDDDPSAASAEELRASVETLQTAVRARDDFIAIAAHELRNPMTPIVGQVQLLLAAARRGDDPPALVTGLERLEFVVRHYVRRATTLLDISRANSGALRLEPATFDLSNLVRETVQGYALLATRARCPLELDVQEGLVGAWDRLAVEQVLDNLLSNALRFGASRAVGIGLAAEEAGVRLTVRDRGVGIAAAEQARAAWLAMRPATATSPRPRSGSQRCAPSGMAAAKRSCHGPSPTRASLGPLLKACQNSMRRLGSVGCAAQWHGPAPPATEPPPACRRPRSSRRSPPP